MKNITHAELENALSKIKKEYNPEAESILTPEQYQRYKILRAIKGLWPEKHLYNTLVENRINSKVIQTNLPHILKNGNTIDIDVRVWGNNIDAKSGFKYSKTWNDDIFDWYYIVELGFGVGNTEEICGYNMVLENYDHLLESKNVYFNPKGFYHFKDDVKNENIVKHKGKDFKQWENIIWSPQK